MQAQQHHMPYRGWFLSGFWVCVVIALAVVVRRAVELSQPARAVSSRFDQINATFSGHAALTFAHIIPAACFVVLAVVVLLRPRTNQLVYKLFLVLGLITGITAYAMSRYAIGGWVERTAVFVFNTWFLFALVRGCTRTFAGDARLARPWILRATVVLLGIATTRPVMGIFFATSPLTHLLPNQFFGLAFWVGFSINTLAVEFWLHLSSRRSASRKYLPEYSATE
jgi:hypothetical protein